MRYFSYGQEEQNFNERNDIDNLHYKFIIFINLKQRFDKYILCYMLVVYNKLLSFILIVIWYMTADGLIMERMECEK